MKKLTETLGNFRDVYPKTVAERNRPINRSIRSERFGIYTLCFAATSRRKCKILIATPSAEKARRQPSIGARQEMAERRQQNKHTASRVSFPEINSYDIVQNGAVLHVPTFCLRLLLSITVVQKSVGRNWTAPTRKRPLFAFGC